MKPHNATLLFAAGAMTTLSACSPYPRTEADFGNSVRHMISSQAVVSGPVDNTPVETGDGQRLNGVIEAYRGDVTRESGSPAPLSITFGGGTPQ
jgi:hypothetical protein